MTNCLGNLQFSMENDKFPAAEGVPGALAAEPPAQLRRLGNDEVLWKTAPACVSAPYRALALDGARFFPVGGESERRVEMGTPPPLRLFSRSPEKAQQQQQQQQQQQEQHNEWHHAIQHGSSAPALYTHTLTPKILVFNRYKLYVHEAAH